jgi:hypothetical protein
VRQNSMGDASLGARYQEWLCRRGPAAVYRTLNQGWTHGPNQLQDQEPKPTYVCNCCSLVTKHKGT